MQLQPNSIKANATFEQCSSDYLARITRRGLRERTMQSYRGALATISKSIGHISVSQLSAPLIEHYLDNLPNHKGKAGAATADSRKNYLHAIRRVLKFAGVREPLSDVVIPKSGKKIIRFYTPSEVATAFAVARPDERGALAVYFFLGIRPEAAGRLDPAFIDYQTEIVFVPAKLSKVGKDNVYGGTSPKFTLPPPLHQVLWSWLRAFRYQNINWNALRARIKRALGGRLIQDGTRHTAGTYTAKSFGIDAAKDLLKHTSINTGIRYYVSEMATVEMANEFFAITPERVGPYMVRSGKKLREMTPEKMIELLESENPNAVAKKLGSSRTAVVAYCRRRKIDYAKIGRRRKRLLRKSAATSSTGAGEKHPIRATSIGQPTTTDSSNIAPSGDIIITPAAPAASAANLANAIWIDAAI